jgi:hypothetical protein
MKSMRYGTLPSKEEFVESFERLEGLPSDGKFRIRNDPYYGTDDLTVYELWAAVQKACRTWEQGSAEPTDEEHTDNQSFADAEQAGDFCSAVLGILGIEWV